MSHQDVVCSCKHTALRKAINTRNLNRAKSLVDTGAFIDFRVNEHLDTMLHKARDAGIALDLLECGANVDLKNVYKRTPLHSAVIEGKTDVLKALLENGARVNVSDSKRCTPVHYAVKSKSVEAIKLLVMHNAHIGFIFTCCMHYTKVPVLTIAMFEDDLTNIKALIKYAVLRRNLRKENRKSINLQPYFGMQNYHFACSYKNDCEDEIRRMKSEKLPDRITLFRMIISTNLHLSYRDTEKKALFSERSIEAVTGNNYPIYRDVIIEKLRGKLQVPGLRKMLLLVQISSVSADSTDKEPTTLNPDINCILAKYLPKNDLFNLILASSEPTIYEINPIKPNLKTRINTSGPIIPNFKRTLLNTSRPIIPNLKRTLMNTSRLSTTIPFAKRKKL